MVPSRPAAARCSLISASAPGSCSSEWFIGSQPSPTSAARRFAAAPSPPMRRLGCGCCTGFGLNITGAKSKNSPWCSTTSSDQSRRQMSMVSSTRRPRVVEVEAGGVPLLLQPAGADAELDATTRDHVERGDRARGDERVAQADVVDVGAEAHVLRGRRDRRQRHAARRTRACSTGSADASRRRAGCPSSPPGTRGAPATTPTRTRRPRRPARPSSRTSC